MIALIIPHIRIQNANALSSPYTVGFPAMTAWLGAAHALQRHMRAFFEKFEVLSVGVISHKADLRLYKGRGDFVYSAINPAFTLDKSGKRASIIEEPRIHLDVSLVLEIRGVRNLQEGDFLQRLERILHTKMRIAGGEILDFGRAYINRALDHSSLPHLPGPGYAIISRREWMKEAMREGKDALDAIMEAMALHFHCREEPGAKEDERVEVSWETKRKYEGWVVPLAVGFYAITEPSRARNARDSQTPHRFAESVVTLGEFRMPHRLDSIDEMMWSYHYIKEKNLYLCETKTTKE